MTHRMRFIVLGLVLLVAGPAVLADDIVHFTNGTFMKVQGYTVDGEMIKVVLGPNASMNFPKNLVEKIERAGRTVYPQGSSGPANVVAAGMAGGQVSGGGQYIQTGEHQVPARFRKGAAPASTEGAEAVDKEAAARSNPNEYQMGGRRGMLRALGRREIPVGEALVEKDPAVPPAEAGKPRGFTSLAPRTIGNPVPPPPPGDAPPEPPPPEAPGDGDDGGSDDTASPD